MNRNRINVAAASVMLSAGLAGVAGAQCLGTKLVDDNPNGLSSMGARSDLGADRLVLGAPGFGTGGRVNIFERVDGVWEEVDEFTSPLGAVADGFGQSVAISINYIAVGAPLTDIGADSDRGRVYIYHRGGAGWSLVETIESPSPDDDDYFGHSVDLRSIGGTPVLVVGCPADDLPGAAGAGTVRVYHRSIGGNWIFDSTVTSTDIGAGEFFGGSVALSTDRLIVGSGGEDVGGLVDAGAAYVFERSGDIYNSGVRILAPAGERDADDTFGISVAISGDRIAVGAPADDQGAVSDCGSICTYFFNGASWAFEKRILEAVPDDFSRVGESIDLHGEVLVSGSPATEEAFLWRRGDFNLWDMDAPMVAWDPPASGSHNFGSSVSLSPDGQHLVVGDSGDDIGGQGNAGSAYLFTTDLKPGANCSGGTVVDTGTYFGCNGGSDDGSACVDTNGSVWYQFTAPCNGILRINTCGTHDLPGQDAGIDTVLSVHSQCFGGEMIACNDDWPQSIDQACFLNGDSGVLYDSAVRINVIAKENYKIRVASLGAAGDTGQFILNVEFHCCRVDWDGNGVVNSTDVSSFINEWFEDQANGTLATDFNGDGVSNSTDVSDFINEWLVGCGE